MFIDDGMSLPNTFAGLVELRPSFAPRPSITHAIFDFDGTLSLIREGWPEVMMGMFEEMIPHGCEDTPESLRKLLYEDMMSLNGKQTIYQMMRYAERVKERGGKALEPLEYKHEYLRRLNLKISFRLDGLADGSIPASRYLVPHSIELLEELHSRGVKLCLASGTDEVFVKREAELLGVKRFFGPYIYGAQDQYQNFSKKMIIERTLRENAIQGAQLIAFGDGYVEIQNTKEAGGLAIAVASDEANPGSGKIDSWKRERLVGVGADVVIPDYRDHRPLLELIFGKAA